MIYPFLRRLGSMEQKIDNLIEAQAGFHAQLATVNATLMSLPERMAAAMVGNSVSAGNSSNKTPTGAIHPNDNEIVNLEQPLQNG